jgi:hypothetical protein
MASKDTPSSLAYVLILLAATSAEARKSSTALCVLISLVLIVISIFGYPLKSTLSME